jgi:type IV secretory pathway VirB4 component
LAIYEEFLPKVHWPWAHLSDKLPWRSVAAPGVIVHKRGGSLQRTYAIKGPDLSSETQEQQGALMWQANNVLKRLGGGWVLHAEAQRVPVTWYAEPDWDNPVSQLISADRRRSLLVDPGSLETRYFLTLTWTPPPPVSYALESLVVKRPKAQQTLTPEAQEMRTLETFLTQADYWIYLLRGMLAQARPLTTNEAATYLKTTCSPRWTLVKLGALVTDFDVRLADCPVVAGWYPFWSDGPDEVHFRVCSITGYPDESTAAAMRGLNLLRFPYRWVTRGIALDKHVQAGLLRSTQGHWVGQKKTIFARMSENISQREAEVQNSDAQNKAEQVDAARQEIGQDLVAYLKFAPTVVVWDRDLNTVHDKIRQVRQVLEGQGYSTTWEKHHAMAAWFSTHPGNKADSVRGTPQSSLTLAHLMPGLQATWTGPSEDAHLKGGPWFLAHTDESSLFRVVNHVNDNGLYMVLGPTRTGKSTLLAVQVWGWTQYRGWRVFAFDLDGSLRCLTYCLGGHWYDLGSGNVGLQPYRRIDTAAERAWRYEWTLARLAEQGVALTDGVHSTVRDALDKFVRATPQARTITEFVYILTEMERHAEMGSRNALQPHYERMKALAKERSAVVDALTVYTKGHLLGHLLDADHDDLGEGALHTFEQRRLLNTPSLVNAVMSYVFHELEQRADTRRPTLVPLDDAAVTWAIPDFEKKGKEWMVTKAKQNWSIGFYTHSLVQVFGSAIGTLLLESCPTRFLLPNPAAMAPELAGIYGRLGLNEEEIRIISQARPQRDYYYSCESYGKRLFHLPLSPLLLAMMGRNRAEDHERMDEVLARVGPEAFAEVWLTQEGYPDAAESIRAWRLAQADVGAVAD